MKRLPFTLPDFTRIEWVSARAREVWEPRMHCIHAAWEVIERVSVLARLGGRRAARQPVAQKDLLRVTEWAALHALLVLPLGWNDMVAILRPDAGRDWLDAWQRHDDDAIGKLLGFPTCCRLFFAHTWGRGQVDTTWDMVAPGRPADGPREANILLRTLGMRAVPHLPCSFQCEATVDLGRAYLALGRDAGYAEEMTWLEEMLDWPMRWTALHGIAEITTPVVKILTRTDATAERLEIRRNGLRYPDEGVTGLTFPFRQTIGVPVSLRLHGALARLA